jgi:ubiquinone/menaquinone biosynthesis C-methylase UbiE
MCALTDTGRLRPHSQAIWAREEAWPVMSTAWDGMAAWYDARQGDEGDWWHRTLIDLTLFRVLGKVDGLRVLDLACGNGYVARRLVGLGARVTGIDASAGMIEYARAREAGRPLGVVYHVADAARLDMLADGTFDVVVSNMGLMNIADCSGALQEAARVLGPRGRLVASISHPCFDVPDASAWEVERIGATTVAVSRKVSRYRQPFEGSCPWNHSHPGDGWQTPTYHRPLSWYVGELRSAGFVLTALEEPEPTAELLAADPQGAWIAEIPLHCVIEAWKGVVE